MKVVYKKPIMEQILALTYEAKMQNKEIDYIELSRQEALQLYDELNNSFGFKTAYDVALFDQHRINQIHKSTCYGIRIIVNNVEGKDGM